MNSTGANQPGTLTDSITAVCVVNAVFSMPAMIGNGLVLGTIWKTQALHTSSNILLFGLALSDFGVGLIVQPMFVFCLIAEIATKRYIASIWMVYRVTQAVFVSATVLTLTAVSVDRFLALYFHLRYTVVVTVKRTIVALFVIWTASFMYALTLIVDKHIDQDVGLHRRLCIIIVFSSLVVNSVVYCMILRIARYHQNQIQNISHMNVIDASNRKRHRKSAFNMFVIFLLLCFCYFPYLYVRIAIRYSEWSPSIIRLTLSWSAVLVYINSSLNPLVYCCRKRDLRTSMKEFVRTVC